GALRPARRHARAARASPRRAVRPPGRARGRPPAAARDGQRHTAGSQRARRLPGGGQSAARDRSPARRPPDVGMDAGDGRRAAPARRRPARGPGGARYADVRIVTAVTEGGVVRRFIVAVCLSALVGLATVGAPAAWARPVGAHTAQAVVPIVVLHSKSGGTVVATKMIIHG